MASLYTQAADRKRLAQEAKVAPETFIPSRRAKIKMKSRSFLETGAVERKRPAPS